MKRLIFIIPILILIISVVGYLLWPLFWWILAFIDPGDYKDYYKAHKLYLYSTTPRLIIPVILNKYGDCEEIGENKYNKWMTDRNRYVFDKKGRNDSRGIVLDKYSYHGFLIEEIPVTDVKIAQIIFSGWIKTDRFDDGEAGYEVVCRNDEILHKGVIYIYGILKRQSSASVKGNTPWTNIITIVDIPITTQKIEIICYNHGKKGAAYFDDIEVKAIAIYEKKNTEEHK